MCQILLFTCNSSQVSNTTSAHMCQILVSLIFFNTTAFMPVKSCSLTLFLPETVLSTDGAISSQGWAQKQVGLTRNAQCENSAPIRKMPKKSDFKHVVVQRPIFAEDKLWRAGRQWVNWQTQLGKERSLQQCPQVKAMSITAWQHGIRHCQNTSWSWSQTSCLTWMVTDTCGERFW